MCLEIKNKESKIADKDIICYKRGIVCKEKFSPYYFDEYEYEKGEKQKKEIKLTPKLEYSKIFAKENNLVNKLIIEKGYHSYIHFINIANHVFIIPKGSEYYVGKFHSKQENSYASSNIIWIGNKWNPLTWLKILFNDRNRR